MLLCFHHVKVGEVSFNLREASEVVIGRAGGDADIQIGWDERISKRHASVGVVGGRLYYEDLGSSNGSWIEGRRVLAPVIVTAGTRIQVGETTLTIGVAASGERPTTQELPRPDLEVAAEEQPDPPVVVPTFVSGGRVELRFDGREAFGAFWRTAERVAGFVFPSETDLAVGRVMTTLVSTPDGETTFEVEVAQYEDGAAAVSLGALDEGQRILLERYISSETKTLSSAPSAKNVDDYMTGLVASARWLLRYVEANDYYTAIQTDEGARRRTLMERLDQLELSFAGFATSDDPRAPRIRAAARALNRIREVLLDRRLRLEYDFKTDRHHIARRQAEAASGCGASMDELRAAWEAVFPGRVERAAQHLANAEAAAKAGDEARAAEERQRAESLSPFDTA